MLHIHETLILNLGLEENYVHVHGDFPQFLQENVRIVYLANLIILSNSSGRTGH
jgi:hypothetical protein